MTLTKWGIQNLTIAAFLVGGFYFALLNLPIKDWSQQISDFAQTQGLLGAFVFGVIYIFATVFLFPCAFLTFAAGMAYGFWAIPLVIGAAAVGACIAFGIARYFARDHIEKLMAKRKKTQALKIAIEEEGWLFLVLIRISPLIPFNLNSYFLGTIRVHFGTYLWATLIGSLPGTILYVYLGILGQQQGESHILKWILFGMGALATVFLARITLKRTQQILDSRELSSNSGI